jgi:hypothetical protein
VDEMIDYLRNNQYQPDDDSVYGGEDEEWIVPWPRKDQFHEARVASFQDRPARPFNESVPRDKGRLARVDPRFRASKEEHRAYQKGTGTHLYEPASDDRKLCRGGDHSCYRCSLCERYFEPFSSDVGELTCPHCEVSGLVTFNAEDLNHLEQVRAFARATGLTELLERRLHYLVDYGHRGNRCVLSKDFAPHSFSFVIYRPGVKGERKFIFNGGLIFQGPSQPADGSFPSLTVSLASGTGRFCHTWACVRIR